MEIASSSDNQRSPSTNKEEAQKSSDQEEDENCVAPSLWRYNDIPMEASTRSKEPRSMEGNPSTRGSSHIVSSPEKTSSKDLSENLSNISRSHTSNHDLCDQSSVPPKKHSHALSVQSINEQTIKKYFRVESTAEREESYEGNVPQFVNASTQKDFRPMTKEICNRTTQVSATVLRGRRGARLNRLKRSAPSDHDFPWSLLGSDRPQCRLTTVEELENLLYQLPRDGPRRRWEHRVRAGRVLRRRTRRTGGRKPQAGRCRRRRPPPHTRPRIPRQRRHRSAEPLPRIKRKKKRKLDDNENEPGARRRNFERPRARSRRLRRIRRMRR